MNGGRELEPGEPGYFFHQYIHDNPDLFAQESVEGDDDIFAGFRYQQHADDQDDTFTAAQDQNVLLQGQSEPQAGSSPDPSQILNHEQIWNYDRLSAPSPPRQYLHRDQMTDLVMSGQLDNYYPQVPDDSRALDNVIPGFPGSGEPRYDRFPGLDHPSGNAPTGFGQNFPSRFMHDVLDPLLENDLSGSGPNFAGVEGSDPNFTGLGGPGSNFTGAEGYGSNFHGKGTSSSNFAGGGAFGSNFTGTAGAPTQDRLGLPDRRFLPQGYNWSDARCNKCADLRKVCSAFPGKAETDKRQNLSKDLSGERIRFPCAQCAKNPQLRDTCTWSITRPPKGSQLYWNGAQAVPHPNPAGRPAATNTYRTYKTDSSFLNRLETPAWERSQNMNEGIYQGISVPGPSTNQFTLPIRPGPEHPNPFGSTESKKFAKSNKRKNRRSKKRRRCLMCLTVGAAERCNIGRQKPCTRCESTGDHCVEDGEDSEISEDDNSLPPAKSGGRVQSTLAFRPKRSERSRSPPNKRGRAARGERSRSPLPARNREGKGKERENLPQGQPTEFQQPIDPGHSWDGRELKRPCDSCYIFRWPCDGQMPCGNCAATSSNCTVAPAPYPRPEIPGYPSVGILSQPPPDVFHRYQMGSSSQRAGNLPPNSGSSFHPQSVSMEIDQTQDNMPANESDIHGLNQIIAFNERQARDEALVSAGLHARNVMEQNFHIQGRGGSSQATASQWTAPNIFQALTLTQHPRDEDQPGVEVLPAIRVTSQGTLINDVTFDQVNGCHEVLNTPQGPALCNKKPTRPCAVINHGQFLTCPACKFSSDQYALVDAMPHGTRISQSERIRNTKLFCCAGCATTLINNQGNPDYEIKKYVCECVMKMNLMWLCNGHRVQAMNLVQKRTLLMRASMRRTLGDKIDLCRMCGENQPNPDSNAWECVSCGDRVVGV